MKKTLLTTMLTLFAAFAATADDVLITYGTRGKDYYKDGTTQVPIGEWYALVWVAEGSQFSGINADVSLKDPTHNRLLKVVQTKTKGCLYPAKSAQMSSAEASALVGGTFYIVLLDTRNADGTIDTSVTYPKAVNGYYALGTIKYESAVAKTTTATTSLVVQTVSGIPTDCPRPEFTYIKPQDGNVVLKIGKTKDYLRYQVVDLNLKSGKTSAISGAEPFNGRTSESDEVELTFPATSETNGFFQVIRQPLQ